MDFHINTKQLALEKSRHHMLRLEKKWMIGLLDGAGVVASRGFSKVHRNTFRKSKQQLASDSSFRSPVHHLSVQSFSGIPFKHFAQMQSEVDAKTWKSHLSLRGGGDLLPSGEPVDLSATHLAKPKMLHGDVEYPHMRS